MINPNLFTLTESTGTYGLHQFKDGEVVIAKLHSSGDWIIIRPATAREIDVFEKQGVQVVAEKKQGK